ncbi:MAG: tRNA-dihydrouridine synthase family protein [Bacteroidales bacterium]|nr:tRNA-dihydrouridine synthase family protein [Bacteroidales bacterium]
MILAPMQGLTEVLFRRVYEECFTGALPLAVSPFIALTRNLRFSTDNAQIRDVLPENNRGSIPVIPQILGKEPDEFVLLANHLYALGYSEVNWNMGCPMRAVTAKHRGCGLMAHPDEVRAILDTVVPRLEGRLSVKVRLGLKDKEEIFAMVPVLNDYPLASVTVHPRLGRQQYTGVPDLDTFGQVLPLIKHPVIYNGDLCTPDDIRRIRQRFPQVADLMVGRGILYRPTLPLEVDGSPTDRESVKHFIRRLLEAIRTTLPREEAVVRKTKEYWSLLWRALPISEMQARQVLRAQELTIVDNLIDSFIQ